MQADKLTELENMVENLREENLELQKHQQRVRILTEGLVSPSLSSPAKLSSKNTALCCMEPPSFGCTHCKLLRCFFVPTYLKFSSLDITTQPLALGTTRLHTTISSDSSSAVHNVVGDSCNSSRFTCQSSDWGPLDPSVRTWGSFVQEGMAIESLRSQHDAAQDELAVSKDQQQQLETDLAR